MINSDWERLVADNYRQIYAFLYQLSGNEAEAEDLIQDTFYKAFKAKRSLPQTPEEQRYYLLRIARNTFFDRFRFLKRLTGFLGRYEAEERQFGESLTFELKSTLKTLPARQREVFILRHLHGLSTAETAKILNIQAGSVKSHLARAVNRIKEELLTTK